MRAASAAVRGEPDPERRLEIMAAALAPSDRVFYVESVDPRWLA